LSLILNIDTSTDTASACITKNGECVLIVKNENQKEHASFIHAAIKSMLQQTDLELTSMDAFAVTSGPGSYTGLRVGMATAKGFCYALSKPLITIGTLEAMAVAAIIDTSKKEEFLYCPMIDARRMEVFAAVYNHELNQLLPPAGMILEAETFNSFTKNGNILFFGTGSSKYKQIEKSPNAFFSNITFSAQHVGLLADKAFKAKKFAEISYSQPEYLKEFFTTART